MKFLEIFKYEKKEYEEGTDKKIKEEKSDKDYLNSNKWRKKFLTIKRKLKVVLKNFRKTKINNNKEEEEMRLKIWKSNKEVLEKITYNYFTETLWNIKALRNIWKWI